MDNLFIKVSFLLVIFLQSVDCYIHNQQKLLTERLNLQRFSYDDLPDFSKDIPRFLQSYPEVFDKLLALRNDSQCYDDWQLIRSYENPFEVFKFWDSYAVPGTGIIEGHVTYPGQPQECFDAKTGYTGIKTPFPDTEMFVLILETFNFGVCMPSSCSVDEAASIFENVVTPQLVYRRNKFNGDAGFVIGAIVFGTILFLSVAATLRGAFLRFLDMLKQMTNEYQMTQMGENFNLQEPTGSENPEQKNNRDTLAVRMLMCLDFYANFCKIFAIPNTPNPDQLSVLNGMRVMSLGWVIIGHLLLVQLTLMDNIIYVIERSDNMLFQTLANAYASVDTFFVMSGCLVMLGSLRALEKFNDPSNQFGSLKFWIMFYVHRLIRLWPALLLTILFVAGIFPNLAPFFYSPLFQSDVPKLSLPYMCKGSKWLSTGFFYNNWVKDPTYTCLGWTWYISNDVQFYVISPIFIVLAKWKRSVSVAAVAFCIFVNTIIVLVASGVNEIPPSDNGFPILARMLEGVDTFTATSQWSSKLYNAFYCRFQTYGVGLILGIAIYEKEKLSRLLNRLEYKIRIPVIGFIWMLGFIAGITNVYGCYFWANGYSMQAWSVAFYNATSRILWGFFISVIVLMCSLGYGGIIDKILGAKFWIPFARVNYTTYIIHLVLLVMYVQTLETVFHFTTIEYTLVASGMLMCINCLSIVISCIIEAPFIQLEKVLLGGKR